MTQAPKYGITIRTKYAILASAALRKVNMVLPLGQNRFANSAANAKSFAGPTGTKIDNHGVHLFRRESAETLVQGLKIGAIQ